MLKLLKKALGLAPPAEAPAEVIDPIGSTGSTVPIREGRAFQERGNAFLANNDFDSAAACYRQSIAADPLETEGYVNLGYALTQLKQTSEAIRVLEQAISIEPTCIDALYMLATLSHNENKLAEAVEYFQKLIELKPDFESLYVELCDVLDQCGRNEEAQSVIAKGISLFPHVARYHYIFGTLYAKANAHNQAINSFRTALSLEPDYANLHYHLAASLYQHDMIDEAVNEFEKAILLKPDYLEAYGKLGTALLRLKRYDDALKNYERELAIEPNNVVALVNQSIALHMLKRDEEALASCDRAMRVRHDSPEVMLNRGVALTALNRQQEALVCYNEANLLRPGDCDILTNRGNALQYLERYDEAQDSFSEALCIKPDHVDANLHLALSRLQVGDYARGWQKYEWRWRKDPLQKLRPNYTASLWLGKEALKGKTILLHAEQGLGDTIQFCRYAQLVSDEGATVLLLVPKVLTSLLSSLEGVDELLVHGDTLPRFDFHCPLLSLPLAFNTSLTTVPCTVPYLGAPLELTRRIHGELGDNSYFRIGVCWQGGTSYAADAERSPGILPFEKFMSRFIGNRVKFHTLLPNSRALFMSVRGEDLGYELDQNTAPFLETAALIMNLDLVVTCDTSIGHIAGALGKPVWLVVPFTPDWRWIRDRDDSPWYPNTRLFRQSAPGNWDELFDRVAVRLNSVLNDTSPLIWPTQHDSYVTIDRLAASDK